jgi:3-hydroxyacyl-CoA dehydrogenase
MGGDRVCAAAETYIGSGRGRGRAHPRRRRLLGMLERVLEGIDEPVLSNLPFIRIAFENIGMAKVATSGDEARERKFLRPTTRSRSTATSSCGPPSGWRSRWPRRATRPPLPKKLHLPGKEGLATFKMMLHNMKLTHWISSHDETIARHLGRILTGGDTTINDPVDEQTVLDLEREAFLSLCGEPKTQDRISYMLVNNKPLRN